LNSSTGSSCCCPVNHPPHALTIGLPSRPSSMIPFSITRKSLSPPCRLQAQSSRDRHSPVGTSRSRASGSANWLSISASVPCSRRLISTLTTAVYSAAWITKLETLPRPGRQKVTKPRASATGSARSIAFCDTGPRLMVPSCRTDLLCGLAVLQDPAWGGPSG
jgi:hypothetical protein